MKIVFSISLFFLLLLLSSCEQIVELDLDTYEPALSANIVLSTNAGATNLYLGRAVSIQDEAVYPALSEAVATLTASNGQSFGLDFAENITSQWEGQFPGGSISRYRTEDILVFPGATYSLALSHPGFPALSAEVKVPDFIGSYSVALKDFIPDEDTDAQNALLEIGFQDNADSEDFYELIAYTSGLDSILVSGFAYYLYFLDNPFPVDFSTDNNLFEDSWRSSLLINDNTFNGDLFHFSVQVQAYPYSDGQGNTYFEPITLELRHISESYYRYYRTLRQQHRANGDPFAEPVLVYNNINGGKGIMAAYSSQFKVITP